MIPVVSSVSGRCSVTKSPAASASSSRRRPLDARLAEAVVADERVVADDAHAEPERAARDLLADPAEAEHGERLAGELDAAPARALPGALLQRGVRLRDVAREGDEEADRLLGRGDDGRVGRVRDDDPAPGRRVDVDVVDADPGAADHLQPVGALDQLGGQLRRRADDDRVVVADRLGEVRVAVDVDVEVLAQELDPRLGDRLADEDARTLLTRAAGAAYASSAARHRGAALDVGARLGQRELDGGERRRDVEDVVVADVADPEEAVLQVAVAAGDGDPEAVAQRRAAAPARRRPRA